MYEEKSVPEKTQDARFWECYVEGTNGGKHVRHYLQAEAEVEAERLARLPNVNGKTVFLFECKAKCKAELSPVKWKTLEIKVSSYLLQ